MKEAIDLRLVNSAIRHHGSLGFTYANNPKAGCGHIKAAMWMQIDKNTGIRTFLNDPHERAASPFVRNFFNRTTYDFEQFARTPFFSVVRNPFSRILSAYLSKIARPRPTVWKRFCAKYGVDPGETKSTFSFKSFLRVIASDKIEELDPHFRPQYINLLYPFVSYKHVGKLEQMDEVHQFMAANGVNATDYNKRPTGANGLIGDYYDSECEAIVRDLYRDDFVQFGYATDLRDIDVVVPVPVRGPVPDRLIDFIRSGGRPTQSGPLSTPAPADGVLRKLAWRTRTG